MLGCAFDATHTITFIALKPGLLTLDGPDHCGRIHLAPIGIDAEASLPANAHEITPAIFSSCLARRRRNSHKGSYGDVVVIGGDKGMTGAALLAGRAALHLGAGRVFVCLLAGEAMQVDPLQPELMLRSADEALRLGGIAVAGPGLGRSPQAHSLLAALLESAPALLLDADALNLVAARPALAQNLRARQVPAIITPHPAEAARLLGADTARVQADRVAAGRRSPPASIASRLLKVAEASSLRPMAAGGSTAAGIRGWPAPAWATCSAASPGPCSRSTGLATWP